MSTLDDLAAVQRLMSALGLGVGILSALPDQLAAAAQPNDVVTAGLIAQLRGGLADLVSIGNQVQTALQTTSADASGDAARLAAISTPPALPPASTPTPSTPSAPASGYTVTQMAGVGVGGLVVGLGLGYMAFDHKGARR